MTHSTTLTGGLSPEATLDRLIDTHGALTTIRALAATLMRRRKVRPKPDALSNHLRRDIGLPPRRETRRHWEIR